MFHVQSHIRRITHRLTEAIAQIKAADTDAITGGKNTYALIDETHEFAKKPRSADVFIEIRGALAARPDGFLVQLTTQSKEPPVGVFKAELAIARAVRDGELKSPLLPILYELPLNRTRDGGWKERRYWPVINPSLGRSVDETSSSASSRRPNGRGRSSWPCSPASTSTSRSASRSGATAGRAPITGWPLLTRR